MIVHDCSCDIGIFVLEFSTNDLDVRKHKVIAIVDYCATLC